MKPTQRNPSPETTLSVDSAPPPDPQRDTLFDTDDAADQSNRIWLQCIEQLRSETESSELSNWILPLFCEIGKNRVWLGAPNRYIVEHVTQHHLDSIQNNLRDLMGDPGIKVSVQIAGSDELRVIAKEKATPKRAGTRGRTSDSVVEQAQMDLFRLERQGQFQAVPIAPQNEFPTLLTRLPIFVPGRARKQKAQIDEDFAIPFQTSWGTGRKFGPPLTVYDEDTLIALGRLRQNMLIGQPSKMPYPVSKLYAKEDQDEVHVHVVYCMLSDVQAMCGTSVGCLLYTSPSPRDRQKSRMPSSA